jgi:5'-nucleotidase
MISTCMKTSEELPVRGAGCAYPLTPACWAEVDSVLLDLDGTLLDLAFDSDFWRQRVPAAWAASRGISPEQARSELLPRFRACEGRLEWYCLDHWSRELGLDIAALKQAHAMRIRWLPGAQAFLRKVRALGKRLMLVTNAHPTALAIKDERTQVISHFDAGFSAHAFGMPKEDAGFWRELARVAHFDAARSLFVDDSLPVLRAARRAGVGRVIAVRRPDSSDVPRCQHEFPAVDGVGELL